MLAILHLPTYALPILSESEPYQKFFKIHKAKIELLCFSSKLAMHLSYNKNGVSGFLTFHKSKLYIIYLSLLLNSIFKDPFHHFPSIFRQFNPSARSTLYWITIPV